jgi:hypothetical protein
MSALLGRLAPYSLIALAIAGVVIWGLIQRNAAIGGEFAAAKGVIKQHEEDARKNAEAVQKLSDTLSKTETKVVTVTEKVYAAPITRDCAQSPAMRAASDGLRQLFSGGQADDRREPDAALRRPAAGPGGGK